MSDIEAPQEGLPQDEETAEETPVEETEELMEEEEEDEDELTVDLDALPKMKVSELKDILKALDLPASGIKSMLIERIQLHFAEEDKQEEEQQVDPADTDEPVDETIADEKELLKESEPVSEYIEVKKPEEEAQPEKELTDEEKKKARAEKFGLESEDDKKEKRAVKFGIETEKSIEEKKEQRAEKFGIDKAEKADDKKAARAARFNNISVSENTSATENTSELSEKLKKRAARFNLDSEPAAKKTAITAVTAVKLDDISEKLKEKIESGSTKVNLSSAGLSLEEKKKLRALKFGA